MRSGREYTVSGNTPILLDRPDRVWYILSGSVQVFAVQIASGAVSGSKAHFFSAGKGELLMGMDLEGFGLGQGLLAVGFPGTRLVELDMDIFEKLAFDPIHTDQAARLIDTWVSGLSQGVTRDIQPCPKKELILESNLGAGTKKDTIAGPESGVVWVECRTGLALFISMETVSKGEMLPLTGQSWVKTINHTTLDVCSTQTALHTRRVFKALDRFHELILGILMLNSGMNSADRYNLIQAKLREDQKALNKGFDELGAVLSESSFTRRVHGDASPLVSASVLVGDFIGLPILDPNQTRQEKSDPTIEEIARASGIKFRQVTLTGKWWKQDHGPLVGFTADQGRPVGLIPCSGPGYKIQDPLDPKSQKLTAALAKGISDQAFTFYPAFPDRSLSFKDMARLGLRGSGKTIAGIFFLGALIGILSLVAPLATDLIFSDIIPGAQQSRLMNITAILVGFSLTTALFTGVRNISTLRIEQRFHYFVESALWDRIMRMPIPFFKQYTAGELANRGMGLTYIRQILAGTVTTTLIASIFSVFNLGLLFYYHTRLAWVAMALLVFAFGVIFSVALFQLKYYRVVTRLEGRISGQVMQFLSALPKIRVAGAEDRAFFLWAKNFARQKQTAFKGGRFVNLLSTFNTGFLLLSMMGLFAWLVFMEDAATLSTGDFLAFNAAYGNLQGALFQATATLNAVIMAIPYFERLEPFMVSVPEKCQGKADPGILKGKLELSNVFFKYAKEGPLILKDVSFQVRPGEFVAVVGPSGSGKSTLIRLLLGFETPDTGGIFYDDQDLAELDITRVRQNMGVVMQGSRIMAGDIFRNIVGTHPLTLDDAWRAARIAGLDKDIRNMPMGMNTMIMEGGDTLSGGQQQRLLISRAVVNQPRLLIFDEATSALDNRTQAHVIESLTGLSSTRIVVAHRLSTIKDADHILVMDKGEIKDRGTYEDLMQSSELFKRIARRQTL